ncbi:MAG: AMIN domain-containing protein, partial [Clostridiales bacterium]|nr:AMIN domain-containing protein [Clostridiales bacterium]
MKFFAKFCMSILFFSIFLIFSQNFVYAQERELVSMMLTTSQGSFLYEKRPVTLNLNGRILPEADMPPIILENRTFVPVRHVMEAMGAVVDFHEEQQRIMIAHGDSLIVMHIDVHQFYHDGTVLYMDVAPQIINDRTLVPVSFIARALDFEVYWENETATVYITSPTAPVIQEPHQSEEPLMPQGRDEGYAEDAHYENGADIIPPVHDAENIDFVALSQDISPGQIVPMDNAKTSVHHVSWNEARTQFAITAAGIISWVDWQMLEDGRLIIDIHNATADFAQTTHTINNGFISTIRTGQNIFDGVYVARIVFDLTMPAVYAVTISDDRHNVFVTFEQNDITQIDFLDTFEALGRESIVITGTTPPTADA